MGMGEWRMELNSNMKLLDIQKVAKTKITEVKHKSNSTNKKFVNKDDVRLG